LEEGSEIADLIRKYSFEQSKVVKWAFNADIRVEGFLMSDEEFSEHFGDGIRLTWKPWIKSRSRAGWYACGERHQRSDRLQDMRRQAEVLDFSDRYQ